MNRQNQELLEEYKKICQDKKQNPSLIGFLEWKRNKYISLEGWETKRQQMIQQNHNRMVLPDL